MLGIGENFFQDIKNQQQQNKLEVLFFLLNSFVLSKHGTPASFSFLISVHPNKNTFLQRINVKNVHPLSSAGIQTHYLSNTSQLP